MASQISKEQIDQFESQGLWSKATADRARMSLNTSQIPQNQPLEQTPIPNQVVEEPAAPVKEGFMMAAKMRYNENMKKTGLAASDDDLFGPNGETPRNDINLDVFGTGESVHEESNNQIATQKQAQENQMAIQKQVAKQNVINKIRGLPLIPDPGMPGETTSTQNQATTNLTQEPPSTPPQNSMNVSNTSSSRSTTNSGMGMPAKTNNSDIDKIYNNSVNAMEDAQLKKLEATRRYEDRLERLDRESVDLAKTPYKDFWSQKSTGNKILAAIAIIGGSYSNALTGNKTNEALGIIKDQINQDLEIQKLNYEKENNAISKSMNTNKNMLDSEMAYLGAAYDLADKKLSMFVSGDKLKEAREGLRIRAIEAGTNRLRAIAVQEAANNKSVKLNPAQLKVDGENRKLLSEYGANRGALQNDLKGLDKAIDILGKKKGIINGTTGSFDSLKPDFINQDRLIVSNLVGDVRSRDLRNTLGPQFTENEGRMLLGYAFDPKLQEDVNIMQIKKLRDGIQNRMNYLDGMQNYLDKNDRTDTYSSPPTQQDSINKLTLGKSVKK